MDPTSIEVKRFVPLLIGLVIVAILLGGLAYLVNRRSSLPPAPEPPAERYTEEDRERLLQSLRAPSTAELSVAERNKTLKTLKAPSVAEVPLAEREELLQSLKAR